MRKHWKERMRSYITFGTVFTEQSESCLCRYCLLVLKQQRHQIFLQHWIRLLPLTTHWLPHFFHFWDGPVILTFCAGVLIDGCRPVAVMVLKVIWHAKRLGSPVQTQYISSSCLLTNHRRYWLHLRINTYAVDYY